MHDHASHARGWFRKGEADLETARKLVASEGPYDTACFHGQQAAEKYLKGLLAFRQQAIPRTHYLQELATLCSAIEPGLVLSPLALAELTPYAVELRYDFDFWPDEGTAREAVAAAEQVRGAVLALMPREAWP